MNPTAETTLFLVHNGGDYSAYAVLALFTDKGLAEEFAHAAGGIVEEWPANVPKEKWMTATANLSAHKKDGQWEVSVMTSSQKPFIADKEVQCELGHYSGWGTKNAHGQYTHGYAHSIGQSKEEARKMCVDAFWQKVAELDELP